MVRYTLKTEQGFETSMSWKYVYEPQKPIKTYNKDVVLVLLITGVLAHNKAPKCLQILSKHLPNKPQNVPKERPPKHPPNDLPNTPQHTPKYQNWMNYVAIVLISLYGYVGQS